MFICVKGRGCSGDFGDLGFFGDIGDLGYSVFLGDYYYFGDSLGDCLGDFLGRFQVGCIIGGVEVDC